MDTKTFNFYSGPAMIPAEVLRRAAEEMAADASGGMSVMEISHRSDRFMRVLEHAENGLRSLLRVPDNYRILFFQGGATLQFSLVPMNLLSPDASADYVITGAWGEKAVAEARRYGTANIVYSGKSDGFTTIPDEGTLRFSPDAAYIHYTSNETIDGVEFDYDLDGGSIPVVCDASSNILSRPIDVEKYGLIYAGAQKNIGPSGVTVVIIREDLIAQTARDMPGLLSYSAVAKHGSMLNTPNTWGIYIIGLVCDWLAAQGGVAAIEGTNAKKAAMLYNALDSSDGFYQGHAERAAWSRMNVTFRLASEDLESRFCDEAEKNGMFGLRGHRSVGGIRASIYNAFPQAGVEALVDFMQDFASKNA